MISKLARRVVDMRSDTVTRPTEAMRQAMSRAVVGDDVYGEDPTVMELEKKGAEVLGKEACVYVTSGTMGNLASFIAHCDRRGSEIIVGDRQHTYLYEQGGASTLAGIHPRVVRNRDDGTLDIQEVMQAIRPCSGADNDDAHYPRTVLVSIENTHNECGGVALPVDYVKNLKSSITSKGLKLHMDGARAGNAAVALGLPLSKVCEGADSISLCLSKGLGAPVGTLVAGEGKFISRVRRAKKALGGGWRQAGVLAATGLIALDTMHETLSKDHRLAKHFAQELNTIKGIRVPRMPQTNLVFFEVSGISLDDFASKLKHEHGILLSAGYGRSENLVRAAVHRDLSEDDIGAAIDAVDKIMKHIP